MNARRRHLSLLVWALGLALVADCSRASGVAQADVTVSPAHVSPTATPLWLVVDEPTDAPVDLVVRPVTVTPVTHAPPTATPGLAVAVEAEPLIITGLVNHQRCGHGEVVAADGHSLLATPRLLPGNPNFLELLARGGRVDIVDCRLWSDREGLAWLAVRTGTGKLGWMLVQGDKFAVTLYPIILGPPRSVTGMPAGTMVAYVPPSECRSGPVSGQAMATSIGVDLIPVVGDLKGLGEAATGCDMVTGEPLGNWRWLGLLGLIGLSEVALLRHGDEAAGAVRLADNLDGSLAYGDEAVLAAARQSDNAADFAHQLDVLGYTADDVAGAARPFDDAAALSDEAVLALARLEQPCSFTPTTLVTTATGHRPIGAVQPGDMVLAYHEGIDAAGYYTVTATFAHTDTTTLTLAVGPDRLETTPDHPFYVSGEWVPAEELAVGDRLTTVGGQPWPITAIDYVRQPRLMVNLIVAQAHTYAVGAGEWLVHNGCGRVLRANLEAAGLPAWTRDGTEWQAHHIIPTRYEDHDFVKRAIAGGWNHDDAINGVPLPSSASDATRLGLPQHSGYSDQVGVELDALEGRALAEGWSRQQARARLVALANRLRRSLWP